MLFKPLLEPFELFASEKSALIAQCKIMNLGAKTKNWPNSRIFDKLRMLFSRFTDQYRLFCYTNITIWMLSINWERTVFAKWDKLWYFKQFIAQVDLIKNDLIINMIFPNQLKKIICLPKTNSKNGCPFNKLIILLTIEIQLYFFYKFDFF